MGVARPGAMHGARLLAGASIVAIVAACQAGHSATVTPSGAPAPTATIVPSLTPTPDPSPSAGAADTIVLTVDVTGGECANGPCGAQYVVYGDGRVDGPPGALQAIPADQMTLIADQVGRTSWDAVREVPFTGECPTAFDGQKHIYGFPAPGGDLVFDSCEFDLSGVEVIQTIDEVLFAGG